MGAIPRVSEETNKVSKKRKNVKKAGYSVVAVV